VGEKGGTKGHDIGKGFRGVRSCLSHEGKFRKERDMHQREEGIGEG